MLSENITKHPQLTLDFEPGLLDRYRSLRDCVAAGVYRRGLSKVAIDLDKAPGNLSAELSGDRETKRHFSVDNFEKFLEDSHDYTAIHYLIAKFLAKPNTESDVAREEALAMLRELAPLMKKAGLLP